MPVRLLVAVLLGLLSAALIRTAFAPGAQTAAATVPPTAADTDPDPDPDADAAATRTRLQHRTLRALTAGLVAERADHAALQRRIAMLDALPPIPNGWQWGRWSQARVHPAEVDGRAAVATADGVAIATELGLVWLTADAAEPRWRLPLALGEQRPWLVRHGDGLAVAAGTTLVLCDTTGTIRHRQELPAPVAGLAPAGEALLVRGDTGAWWWHAGRLTPLTPGGADRAVATHARYSVRVGRDARLHCYRTGSPRPLRSAEVPTGGVAVTSAAIDAAGTTLMLGYADGRIALLRLPALTPVDIHDQHLHPVTTGRFHAGGRFLTTLATGRDRDRRHARNHLVTWDLAWPRAEAMVRLPHVRRLAWDADGTRVAYADRGRCRLLAVPSGRHLAQFKIAHKKHPVRALAIGGDHLWVIEGGRVRIASRLPAEDAARPDDGYRPRERRITPGPVRVDDF